MPTEPVRHPFTDPITGAGCVLVIPAGGRIFRDSMGSPQIGIEHPGCPDLADLSVELDAFYCPACRWNGRVSGAWAVDQIEEALNGSESWGLGRCAVCGRQVAIGLLMCRAHWARVPRRLQRAVYRALNLYHSGAPIGQLRQAQRAAVNAAGE